MVEKNINSTWQSNYFEDVNYIQIKPALYIPSKPF